MRFRGAQSGPWLRGTMYLSMSSMKVATGICSVLALMSATLVSRACTNYLDSGASGCSRALARAEEEEFCGVVARTRALPLALTQVRKNSHYALKEF